jgi:hypothetical protein
MEEGAKNVCFDRKEVVPDDARLKTVLGETYPAYREILALTEVFPREWKYYGAKHGWQLKIMQKGKALLYLVPLEMSFRVGFAVREEERKAFLASKLPAELKEELTVAKKYPEGYPLRLPVRKKSDMKAVRLIITALLSLRS